MDHANPYAPPEVDCRTVEPAVVGPEIGVWRDGNLAVVHVKARIPEPCIATGNPATRRVWIRLLYSVWMREFRLEIPISPPYYRRHLLRVVLPATLGLISGAVAVLSQSPRSMGVGFVMLIIMAIGVFTNHGLSVSFIRGPYVWILGASPKWLATLPAWPEERAHGSYGTQSDLGGRLV